MINITKELKSRLLTAQSAEEAAALVKADGQEITAEDAARLWAEISRMREKDDGKELSLDELEAISGGEDRDWITDGCAATVEEGSDCWSTDRCHLIPVTYTNLPNTTCPFCGKPATQLSARNLPMAQYYTYGWWCRDCGYSGRRNMSGEIELIVV